MRTETKCLICECHHPRDGKKYPGPLGTKHKAPCVRCTVKDTKVVITDQIVVGFL